VYFGTVLPATPTANVTAATYSPGPLGSNTTYFWKIVAKDACGMAAGCATWSFTTSPCIGPPACAATPVPADAATGIDIASALTWAAVPGATSYDVYFSTTLPLPVAPTANVTAATYDPPGDMALNQIYYWQIVPKNACGAGAGCSTWSFTTGVPGCAADLGDTEGTGDITAYDASLILQAVVGLITLDLPSQCRSDASGGGGITAFDASLDLQCVVGLCVPNLNAYPEFQASCTAHGHCP